MAPSTFKPQNYSTLFPPSPFRLSISFIDMKTESKYLPWVHGYGHFSPGLSRPVILLATRWRHRVLEGSDSRATLLESIATPSYIPVPSLALLPKSARFSCILLHICWTTITYSLKTSLGFSYLKGDMYKLILNLNHSDVYLVQLPHYESC